MADTYGSLPIPPAAPGAGETVSDPALDRLAAYIAAVLNAYVQTAWSAVAPTQSVVAKTFTHDPEEASFSDRNLPALYLWRGEGDPQVLADEYHIDRVPLQLLWVFQPTAQERKKIRAPIFNAVTKIIGWAIDKGRDPNWVDAGDTDPTAATRGSQFLLRCGFLRAKLRRPQMAGLTIQMDDGGENRVYDAIRATIEVEERETRDPTTYSSDPAAINLDVTVTDADNGTVTLVEFDDPAS